MGVRSRVRHVAKHSNDGTAWIPRRSLNRMRSTVLLRSAYDPSKRCIGARVGCNGEPSIHTDHRVARASSVVWSVKHVPAADT